MKMVFAIVNDHDAQKVMDELSRNRFTFTNVISTGGFLKAGNTTLIIGVEADQVDTVIALIRANAAPRTHMADPGAVLDPSLTRDGVSHTENAELAKGPAGITVAGATIFVTDAEKR
jgi:uncharacterized protein YaaQ